MDNSEAYSAGAMEEFRVAIRQAKEANIGRNLKDARHITRIEFWSTGEWCSNWKLFQ